MQSQYLFTDMQTKETYSLSQTTLFSLSDKSIAGTDIFNVQQKQNQQWKKNYVC
jgi:hypothetical protein